MRKEDIIIKTCPFCGGEAEPLYYTTKGNSIKRETPYTSNILMLSHRGTIKCKKCEIVLPRTYKTVRYAIEVWNRRNTNE